jgi:myosin heavy subunit
MTVLNEAELSKSLGLRYEADDYMTYIGPTLIVINPFKFIKKYFPPSLKRDYMLKVYGLNKIKV